MRTLQIIGKTILVCWGIFLLALWYPFFNVNRCERKLEDGTRQQREGEFFFTRGDRLFYTTADLDSSGFVTRICAVITKRNGKTIETCFDPREMGEEKWEKP